MIEMMKSFSRSIFFRGDSSIGSPKVTRTNDSFGSPRVTRTSWIPRWFHLLVVIGSVISFSVAFGIYFYVLPNLTQAFHGYGVSPFDGLPGSCNVFDGSWLVDDGYPLYNASECPFVEQGFNCLANGRIDKDYLKWRWKPNCCEIPRFNVRSILEQWESLIYLLMTGVDDKRSVYEVNGNNITKQIRYLGVRFSSFNFTFECYRSVFLVQHNWAPKHGPKRVRSTLKLDKLNDISEEWIDSDVLIFNSG